MLRTETLWSKKNKTQRTIPKGNATPTHLPGSSQKRTSHARPPAGWNAPEMGSVSGLEWLNRPQYASPETATSEMGIP